MNTALRNRVAELERRTSPSAVLFAIVQEGETADEAISRVAAEWGRPAESFTIRIVLDFVSPRTG